MTLSAPDPRRERLLRLARHAAWRLLGGLLVLWAAASLTFFALRLMPGDPVLAILGGPSGNPTPETIAEATREYGLDRPLAVQYAIHLGHLLRGDLGTSYSQHLPVTRILAEQTGATLQLTFAALALAWLMVLGWTLLSAGRRHWFGGLASLLETLAAALPQFWLAILLLAAFAFGLQLFPRPAAMACAAWCCRPWRWRCRWPGSSARSPARRWRSPWSSPSSFPRAPAA